MITLDEWKRRMGFNLANRARMCREQADDIESTFLIFGHDPELQKLANQLRDKADELDERI